jgi:hypothetical protein
MRNDFPDKIGIGGGDFNMAKFRTGIGLVMIVLFGISCYIYAGSRKEATVAEEAQSEANELLVRDIENNYPDSPRKVIEYYSDIMICFYETGTDSDTVDKLAERSRLLFDTDLLENNPEGIFYENIKNQVEAFHNEHIKITLYTMGAESDVKYAEVEKNEYATVTVKYYLRDDGGTSIYTYIDFLLRRDIDKRWKILGWKQTDLPKE